MIYVKINVKLDYRGMPKKLVEEWKATIEKLREKSNVFVEE